MTAHANVASLPAQARALTSVFCRVIDVLPKLWGKALAADYLQQLTDKEAFHQTLLRVLEDVNALHLLDPQALR